MVRRRQPRQDTVARLGVNTRPGAVEYKSMKCDALPARSDHQSDKQSTKRNTERNAWQGTAFAICLFCGILVFAFTPVWLQHRVLAPLDIVQTLFEPWGGSAGSPKTIDVHNHFVTDAVTQFLVYRHVAETSLRQDGYIGWNPLIFGGTPEYANTISTYFDWTMQLHRLFGFWAAWHLGLFFQFAIAGIGMLVFLRSRSLSPPVCLAAAIAYAGNSQFLLLIYYRSALGSFCWVPWMLWALERSLQGPLARVIPFALFTALAFLGGSIQYAAFILLLLPCVVLSRKSSLSRMPPEHLPGRCLARPRRRDVCSLPAGICR